ncbi:hypothetical protein FKM82_023367 [Ascaphus truei]
MYRGSPGKSQKVKPHKTVPRERKPGIFQCISCNITCTSLIQLEEHLAGAKHKLKSRQKEGGDGLKTGKLPKRPKHEDFGTEPVPVPATCDSSSSETALSSPAPAEATDNQPQSKKLQTDLVSDDENLPCTPSPSHSSCSSTNYALEALSSDEKLEQQEGEEADEYKTEESDEEDENTCTPLTLESNEDLFHFLKNFEVASAFDIPFILKVKQKFSSALKEFREESPGEEICYAAVEESGKSQFPFTAAHSSKPAETPAFPSARPLHTTTSYKDGNREAPRAQSSSSPAKSSQNQSFFKPSSVLQSFHFGPSTGKQPTFSFSPNPSSMSDRSSTPRNVNKAVTPNVSNSVNASDVIDMLRKNAAENPAFKGLDINTVIKILMESGKLKSQKAEAASSDEDDV